MPRFARVKLAERSEAFNLNISIVKGGLFTVPLLLFIRLCLNATTR